MAVLVTLLAVVLALLALLVAGLLRSHAEILRALHQLGVNMDPARPTTATASRRPVGVADHPLGRGAEAAVARARSTSSAPRPSTTRSASPSSGAQHLTLLAFLSSGCGSCLAFWDVFRDGGPVEIPGDARLVCVSKDAGEESVAEHQAPRARTTSRRSCRARRGPTTTCPSRRSSCSLDGASGDVIGEGAANEWGQVQSLLHTALDDAGMLDRKGNLKGGGRRGKPRADVLREARADRDLLAAGIRPGDPSLYTLPSTELPEGRCAPVTDLVAHGIEVSLPAGWEGRLFRRPRDGEVAAQDAHIEGEPAAPQETTNAVLHASTIAVPPGVGDFASGAVDKLARRRHLRRAVRVRPVERRHRAVPERRHPAGPRPPTTSART